MDNTSSIMWELSGLGSLTILGFIFWFFRYIHNILKNNNDLSRKRILDLLDTGFFIKNYIRLLNYSLDLVSNHIGDHEQISQYAQKPTGIAALFASLFRFHLNPWTGPSYRFSLRLAFVYPIILLFLNSFWLSNEGNNILFWGIIVFVMILSSAKYFLESKALLQQFLFILITVVLYVFAITVVSDSSQIFNPTSRNVFLAFIAVFAAYAAYYGGAVGTMLAAGTIILVFLSIATNFLWVFLIIPIFILYIYVVGTQRPSTVVYWWGVIWVTFLIAGFYSTPLDKDGMDFMILFSLVILPLVNVPLDWFSLGVTRGLLHAIVHQKHSGWVGVMWVLLDVVVAFILMMLMAMVLILTMGMVGILPNNAMSHGHSLMLQFCELKNSKIMFVEYGWFYGMLLTTLVPTFIHMVLASGAMVLIVPRKRTSTWAESLRKLSGDKTDSNLIFLVASYFTFVVIVAIGIATGSAYIFYRFFLDGGFLDIIMRLESHINLCL